MPNRPFALLALLALLGCQAADRGDHPSSHVATSERFAFHSNLWLNLHHVLYKHASGEGRTPIDSAQLARVEALADADRAVWDEAIAYYAEHHVDDNIRTDDTLYTFKRWVIDLPPDAELVSEEFDPEWLAVLRAVTPVYRDHFWPEHDVENRRTLGEHWETIELIEDPVFERLAQLGRNDWPAEPIRVDLSYYGNWAGAYTTNDPVTHVVISSVDIQPPGNWLELLFHEPSHGIIGGWSPVGEAIDSVAAAHGVEPPRQLWHAMLFYFSGRAVQDELAALGRTHELYMVDKDVFSRFHPLLFVHVEPYVAGEISLEESLDRIMTEVSASDR